MTMTPLIRKDCVFFQACLWIVALVSMTSAAPVEAEKGHVGFTVVHDAKSGLPMIGYVAEKSPAAEAGVAVGDEVVAVNNVSTFGRSIIEIKGSVEGPVDTTVQLTLRRIGTPGFQVSVVRRTILAVYQAAAIAGDPKAQYYVGYFYERGPRSSRDLAKAAEWYRQSADRGYAPAQTVLGYRAAYGLDTTKDPAAAASWYLKAASQDDAIAERELARCYYQGSGVPQNDRTAFDWFYRSAQQDDPVAENYLGTLYQNGRGITRDDRLAFAWYYRSAILNNPYAQWNVAYFYAKGRGVKQDQAEALVWYRKAAAGLPAEQSLKNTLALANLRAFLTDPGSAATLDLSLFPAATRKIFACVFYVLAIICLLGVSTLLFFSFRLGDASEKLSLALGWIVFYLEGQGVVFFGLCLLGTAVSAGTLIGATSAVCGLPIILSSCGPVRARLWKAPTASPKQMLLYSGIAVAAVALIAIGYSEAYFLIIHSPLPHQSTLPLFMKAKNASAWMTYASVAILLPVAEEIIFRGYLFDATKRYLSDGKVIVITALVFSAIHLQWLYFLPLVGYGMILGGIRLKTGSLWLPVLLHIINNGVALAFPT